MVGSKTDTLTNANLSATKESAMKTIAQKQMKVLTQILRAGGETRERYVCTAIIGRKLAALGLVERFQARFTAGCPTILRLTLEGRAVAHELLEAIPLPSGK
jgi:DNA-binding MarR family transcriptional regulator